MGKFLLEHGGDLNVADQYGRTPLHVAAAVDYADMCEFLIENRECWCTTLLLGRSWLYFCWIGNQLRLIVYVSLFLNKNLTEQSAESYLCDWRKLDKVFSCCYFILHRIYLVLTNWVIRVNFQYEIVDIKVYADEELFIVYQV